MSELVYTIAGDRGILVKFNQEIKEETYQSVMAFEKMVKNSDLPGILETNMGFCALFISYDPLRISHKTLMRRLKELEQKLSDEKSVFPESGTIEIPVIYGGEYGPDLTLVAELLHVSEEEVIQQHLFNEYLVYVTGHVGGTAFFKGKGELFKLTRKKTPVIFYPAGSLIFADGIGAVFKSIGGPTAWYSIGMSPLRQWYPDRDPPVLIKSGDRIRYRHIGPDEFQEIKKEVDRGTYLLKYL